MAHIKHKEATNSKVKTPSEWLGVGYEITQLVNKWSDRTDLVALINQEAGQGAPACYIPAFAEVEVNSKEAFGEITTPNQVNDLTKRANQYEWAKATGAIRHEAYHAKFSAWDMPSASKALKDDEYSALVLLEEGRIEAWGIKTHPDAKVFLRASAMGLIIDEAKEVFGKETSSVASASSLVGLCHARVIAGSLDEDEALDLIAEVEKVLGKELVDKLEAIIKEFQAHSNHTDISACYPLAKEWAKLVREKKEEMGESEGGCEFPTFVEIMKEMLGEMEKQVPISNERDLQDQKRSEDMKESATAKEQTSKEQKKNEEIAKEVFSKSTGPGESATRSRLTEKRPPNGAERNSAVKIARALERAKYRERGLTEKGSVVPPGKLNTRKIIEAKALEQRGVFTQPTAFTKKVRKHTDEPPLTVGVMVDISGSMGSAMNPMASTAWIMSEAVRRVQGNVAMVYYGSDVFPTLKRGQRLKEVNVYSAPDGTEKFDKAFRALDGALHLIYGQGARLLVVVSDGQYTPQETESAKSWIKTCSKNGVAVLWLPIGSHDYYAKDICEGANAEIVVGITDPTSSALAIGKCAERVLSTAGKRLSA
jgi:hypothetical protein